MRRRELVMAATAMGVTSVVRASGTPAVLELFTSQGCSSCPPADALLGKLARDPAVIALAWHVDYWNRLGWRDPYSSALATERQRRYAAQLRDEVYTPALVVNGTQMVVGSDGAAIRAAMGDGHGFGVNATLRREGAAVIAHIGVADQSVTAVVATYDPQHATTVGAGENGGRQLTEYRIVRSATSLGDWDGTPRKLVLPEIAAGQGCVLLLQAANLTILGAADLAPL